MVLGFLSFMVVSAVAFAIYMRSERVPSSAFRRNVATRHLVKAALAQAMSRVDDAIRADPFPGRPNTNSLNIADFYHDGKNNAMDVWYGRVFMPPDPEGVTEQANEPGNIGDSNRGFASRFAPITETVSTLTLEALGYVPPPLVNDVRFLSRSTWTAKWQNFAYDAGRFAFCAVNVSDYFDINRVNADIRTTATGSRISVAHLLRNLGGNSKFSDVTQSDIDNFNTLFGPEATARPMEGTYPYVSMLDYNLALGTKGDSGINNILRSCFCWWINGRTHDYFYFDGSTDSSDGVKSALRQPFVTDSWATSTSGSSWEVVTNKADVIASLSTLKGQPFHDINMTGNGMTVSKVATATATDAFLKRMYEKGLLGRIDIFTFYDYLDHDDVPLSLAMPSVECVPMVTAVELVGGALAKLKVNPPGSSGPVLSSTAPGPATRTTTTEYMLDPSSFIADAAGVRLLVAFPFRHYRGRNIDDFKVQVAMKVFVAPSGSASVRPANGLSALRPQNKAEWGLPSKAFTVDGNAPGDALAWSLYSDKVNVSIPNDASSQRDAIMQIDVRRWNGSSDANVPGNQKFFSTVVVEEGTVSPTGTFKPNSSKNYVQFNLRPFDANGQLLPAGQIEVAAGAQAPYATDKFQTYAMLWVRITDSSGNETYDLAPAIVADDELNGRSDFSSQLVQAIIGKHGGTAPGCLLFGANQNTAYTYEDLQKGNYTGLDGSDRNWQPKALAVVDPRYNYAPEDWFVWDQSVSAQGWLQKLFDDDALGVANNRDADIFMFTSNQGYLQSLGEFAFLPMLSEQRSPPNGYNAPILKDAPGASAGATHAAQPKAIMNWDCAWRTYPADNDFFRDCASIGIWRSATNPQAVNPYTDNAEVLYAAFANTPCDYWVTGRSVAGLPAAVRGEDKESDDNNGGLDVIFNKMGDRQTSGDPIEKFSDSLKYAFCEKNADPSSQIKSEKVREVAASIGHALRSHMTQFESADLWKDAYDGLPWFDNLDPKDDSSFERFMGVDLENPLYSVDRKFLYSYWRDCFANKQQLFLIFVRAESSALGGTGEGTPSQQGGRAVALVWRDPHSNRTDGGRDGKNDDRMREYQADGRRRPHRMRLLFYHQFD